MLYAMSNAGSLSAINSSVWGESDMKPLFWGITIGEFGLYVNNYTCKSLISPGCIRKIPPGPDLALIRFMRGWSSIAASSDYDIWPPSRARAGLSPPLQKGEAVGMPRFIEMLLPYFTTHWFFAIFSKFGLISGFRWYCSKEGLHKATAHDL